jgi:glycerol-3-phosphate responsive antiterminator
LRHNILVDATVDFDVFSKKNQKVILTAKLVRNQVSNGFNITGFISTKGKVSGHGNKRMIYLCFNLFFLSRKNLNNTSFNQLTSW